MVKKKQKLKIAGFLPFLAWHVLISVLLLGDYEHNMLIGPIFSIPSPRCISCRVPQAANNSILIESGFDKNLNSICSLLKTVHLWPPAFESRISSLPPNVNEYLSQRL